MQHCRIWSRVHTLVFALVTSLSTGDGICRQIRVGVVTLLFCSKYFSHRACRSAGRKHRFRDALADMVPEFGDPYVAIAKTMGRRVEPLASLNQIRKATFVVPFRQFDAFWHSGAPTVQ